MGWMAELLILFLLGIIMKTKYNKWLVVLLGISFVLSGCEEDSLTENLSGNGVEQNTGWEQNVPEGCFVANLLPATSDVSSRALVNGSSTAIQSLRFLIFKAEMDDSGQERYVYYNPEKEASNLTFNEVVFSQESATYNQSYTWPLNPETYSVKVTLPNGKYRVVFLGNMMDYQFSGQAETSSILNLSNGEFDNVRINLPSEGPRAFYPLLNTGSGCYQNAFYMGSADFDNANPSPRIVLQRLVSQSTFSRDFIDTNEAIDKLVDSIVEQIKGGNLSTDIVKGVLKTNLTKILDETLGTSLLYPVTTVVDRLVNILLGDIVNMLHQAVLNQVTGLVTAMLQANENAPLFDVLNPWSVAGSVDAKIALVKSIDLNRVPCSYEEKRIEGIPVENKEEAPSFTITSLNGPFTLMEARVQDKDGKFNNAIPLLRPAASEADDAVLAGLLVNIQTSLGYTQESNQKYFTTYDLLNLGLQDYSLPAEGKGQTITIETDLSKIIDSKKLSTAILGDGILSGVVSGLTGGVDKLVNVVLGNTTTSLLQNLDLRLPNIAIGNISLDGRWGNTRQADGTIVTTQIGEEPVAGN